MHYNKTHHCEAAVIACMDFRFHRATVGFIENELGIIDYDLITEAGGVKGLAEDEKVILDEIKKHLDISLNLHHSKHIILVNHEDCGAYGGSKRWGDLKAEKKYHDDDLKKAVKVLQKLYPEQHITAIYAYFNEFGGISHEVVVK